MNTLRIALEMNTLHLPELERQTLLLTLLMLEHNTATKQDALNTIDALRAQAERLTKGAK
jgi:hypothetical protein